MRILVTAGPTRESIDPVRFISNRSTGRMGYAVARAAVEMGHDVSLISGPVSISAPEGVDITKIVTAADMLDAVVSKIPWCDALVMSAAVSDWHPEMYTPRKMKKGNTEIDLKLVPTQDILRAIMDMKEDRIYVGFAAETEDLEENAGRKLKEKNLDLIVANDISQSGAGFEVDTNIVTFITDDNVVESFPLLKKSMVGKRIIEWIEMRAKQS
ncbi:MAG: phosphopantothenoylcysteine decarboxylase [Kiritimatiellae bacterium]|nr:phosphopantothenoylcysteine decarboxylase [Kiritimatiellia bacterium]